MKQRPQSISIIAAIFWSLSLVLLVSGFHTKTQMSHAPSLWLAGGSMLVGFGVWNLRLWGFWAFTGFSLILMGLALWDFFRDQSLFVYITVVGTALILGVMYYFVQKHVAAPYYNPQLHEAPYRFKTRLQSEIALGGERRQAEVLDISKTGCFVDIPDRLKTGEVLSLHIYHGRVQVALMARVVRKSRAPQGYGLMFLDLGRDDKTALNRVLDDISHEYYESLTQESA